MDNENNNAQNDNASTNDSKQPITNTDAKQKQTYVDPDTIFRSEAGKDLEQEEPDADDEWQEIIDITDGVSDKTADILKNGNINPKQITSDG